MLISCCKFRPSPILFDILTNIYSSAASAIAANTFLRSLFGAAFPLFATYLFNGLGIQWASTLLGAIAALLVPIPILFYIYGHRIRARSAFAPTSINNTPGSAAKEPSLDSGKDMSEEPKEIVDHAAASNAPRMTGSNAERA
jgi:MFS transporter, DHA1 family, multidrug resistance protein